MDINEIFTDDKPLTWRQKVTEGIFTLVSLTAIATLAILALRAAHS